MLDEISGICGRDKEKATRKIQQKNTERFKIPWFAFREGSLVLIRWLLGGCRGEETVPLKRARHRRIELEAKGAVVYWSERLLRSSWLHLRMVQAQSLARTKSKMLPSIILAAGIFIAGGCQRNSQNLSPRRNLSNDAISQLEIRVEKIESLIKKQKSSSSNKDFANPSRLIKSITFRIGTEDDRLRIYWADGSNTDLPCTKEQSIWACG